MCQAGLVMPTDGKRAAEQTRMAVTLLDATSTRTRCGRSSTCLAWGSSRPIAARAAEISSGVGQHCSQQPSHSGIHLLDLRAHEAFVIVLSGAAPVPQ